MKVEDLVGEASIRKGTMERMVQLVGEEREAVVQEVTASDERKIKIETEKAAKMKIWNEEIKNEETLMHNGCMKLKGGVLRKFETREYFFWKSGKVVVVRVDTGDIVDERPIKPEEQIQDLEKPDIDIKAEDIPEEMRARLLAFVPKASLLLAAPVETECAVVDDELPKPKHLCAECVHCNEQPGCRDRLTKGEILFNGDNPDAEVLECVKFEPVSSDVQTSSGETNQAENGTEGTENGTPGAPDETVAHGRKKSSSRKKSGKKAA